MGLPDPPNGRVFVYVKNGRIIELFSDEKAYFWASGDRGHAYVHKALRKQFQSMLMSF